MIRNFANFLYTNAFPLENISCVNFLSGLDLYVGKLLSIGKYLASKQYVRFVHLQPMLDVFFLRADILYHFVCVR